MRYAPRVTDEEVADMVRLRKEGRTQKEIAEWIGCAENTVGFHLRLNGMPRQRIWTDTTIKKLLELVRQGISATEIARQMGMTYRSVTMELFLLRKKLGTERVPRLHAGRPATHLPAKYLKRGDLHRFTFFRIDSGLYEVTYRRSATLAYTARVEDMEMIRKTHLAKCAEKEGIRTLRDYVINYAKEHRRAKKKQQLQKKRNENQSKETIREGEHPHNGTRHGCRVRPVCDTMLHTIPESTPVGNDRRSNRDAGQLLR